MLTSLPVQGDYLHICSPPPKDVTSGGVTPAPGDVVVGDRPQRGRRGIHSGATPEVVDRLGDARRESDLRSPVERGGTQVDETDRACCGSSRRARCLRDEHL